MSGITEQLQAAVKQRTVLEHRYTIKSVETISRFVSALFSVLHRGRKGAEPAWKRQTDRTPPIPRTLVHF